MGKYDFNKPARKPKKEEPVRFIETYYNFEAAKRFNSQPVMKWLAVLVALLMIVFFVIWSSIMSNQEQVPGQSVDSKPGQEANQLH